MAIPLYLAKTEAEFALSAPHPHHCAWMACHFSPCTKGIVNLPKALPPDSVLILNDRIPANGHDPAEIKDTIQKLHDDLHFSGLLLDFERPDIAEQKCIARLLLSLPFPVCVSQIYGDTLDCPVFLPPVPITTAPEEYLLPWKGREIWLDITKESICIEVTEHGCRQNNCPQSTFYPFRDKKLHCRYRMVIRHASAEFFLTRDPEDIDSLLEQVTQLGVTRAIGLWQEFR